MDLKLALLILIVLVLVPFVSAGEITVYAYGPNGLLSSASDKGVLYYHQDNLGSVALTTLENGFVASSTDYYPFGSGLNEVNPGITDRGYLGNIEDGTGLGYFMNRYYDSSIGRFVSSDPLDGNIFNPQRLNKYSYGLNNPLRYTDRDGLDEDEVNAADFIPSFTPEYGKDWEYVGAKVSWEGFGNTLTGPEVEPLMDEEAGFNLRLGPKSSFHLGTSFNYLRKAFEVRDTLWNDDGSVYYIDVYTDHDMNVKFSLGGGGSGVFYGVIVDNGELKFKEKIDVGRMDASFTSGDRFKGTIGVPIGIGTLNFPIFDLPFVSEEEPYTPYNFDDPWTHVDPDKTAVSFE